MRSLVKYLLILFTLFQVASYAIDEPILVPKATDNFTEEEIKDLKEWIKNKRQRVGIKSLGGDLTISGQVSVDMGQTNEVVNGVKQVGSGSLNPNKGTRAYNVSMDLLLNYKADPTWIATKLKFKNKAGVTTGTSNSISLERAFMGVRFLEGETYTMDFEFGRRQLLYTFDSLIQFRSYMDGAMYKYDQSIDDVGDLYFHGGPFVVDFKKDHYSYVFEFGVLNIGNTGIYTKYSFIDWDTKNYGNTLCDDEFRFRNSQVILGYKTIWFGKVVTLFGAGLINSAARRLEITANKKANVAWYAGFFIGEAKQRGDWAVNCNYQYVMPQAVPNFDSIGVGRGNASGCGFYYNEVNGQKVPTTRRSAVGTGNYKGFTIDILYLFTGNLTLSQSYSQSIRQDKAVGPIFRYKNYTLKLTYIF